MKKIVLAIGCFLVTSTISAEIVKEEYYGSKANDSMKNPCKGECVTKCAVKYRDIYAIDNTQTAIDEVLYDGDEAYIIGRNSYIVNLPKEQVLNEIFMMRPPRTDMDLEIVDIYNDEQ